MHMDAGEVGEAGKVNTRKDIRNLVQKQIQPAVCTYGTKHNIAIQPNWACGAIRSNRKFILYLVQLNQLHDERQVYKIGYTRRFISLDGVEYGRADAFKLTHVHVLAWVSSAGNHTMHPAQVHRERQARGQGNQTKNL